MTLTPTRRPPSSRASFACSGTTARRCSTTSSRARSSRASLSLSSLAQQAPSHRFDSLQRQERRRVGLVPRRLQQRADQPRARPRRGEHVRRHGARHLDDRALERRQAHLPCRRQPRGAARDAPGPAPEQGDALPRRPRAQARPARRSLPLTRFSARFRADVELALLAQGRPPRDGRRARDAPHLGLARRALPALLQQPSRARLRPRLGVQAVDADPRAGRPVRPLSLRPLSTPSKD